MLLGVAQPASARLLGPPKCSSRSCAVCFGWESCPYIRVQSPLKPAQLQGPSSTCLLICLLPYSPDSGRGRSALPLRLRALSMPHARLGRQKTTVYLDTDIQNLFYEPDSTPVYVALFSGVFICRSGADSSTAVAHPPALACGQLVEMELKGTQRVISRRTSAPTSRVVQTQS